MTFATPTLTRAAGAADELRTGGRVTREALVGMAAISGALDTEFGDNVTSTDAVTLRSRVQRVNASLIILNSFFESYARGIALPYAEFAFLSRGVTSLRLPSCPGLGSVQTCPHVPQRK